MSTVVSPAVVVAAVLVAVAVALALPGPAALAVVSSERPEAPGRRLPGRSAGEAAVVGVVLLVVGLLSPVGPLVLATLAVAGLVVVRLRAAGRAEQDAASRRERVVEACEALAGELRAGRPLAAAVEGAAEVWPDLAPVAVRARLGGDVPGGLREVARRPGAEALRRAAGAWELCSTSGTGLVEALDRVLDTVRSDQDARRQVRTELAATRATSRMVSALPLLVLLVAQGAGARPWHLLTGTLLGQVCLLGGVVLVGTGLLWVERIARSAVEDR